MHVCANKGCGKPYALCTCPGGFAERRNTIPPPGPRRAIAAAVGKHVEGERLWHMGDFPQLDRPTPDDQAGPGQCSDCHEWRADCSCWQQAKKRVADRRAELTKTRRLLVADLHTARTGEDWRAAASFGVRLAVVDAELAGLALAMGDDE